MISWLIRQNISEMSFIIHQLLMKKILNELSQLELVEEIMKLCISRRNLIQKSEK